MSTTLAPTPSKWWQVYQGDEECRFFKALSRSKHDWRTTDGIAKEARLTIKRTQEILQKYLPSGIVRPHQSDADKWQYWERGSSKPSQGTVVEENQKKRVEDAIGTAPANPSPKHP